MPFDEAAAFVLTYGTTHYALKWRANLQPGETVWVPGASGGIGLSAIELARAMGARVFAGASSQDKLDLALAKGAEGGLVYPHAPLDKAQVRKLSDDIKALGGGGVDVVYDGVGGDYAEPALRALNWEGRFLVVGFPAGIPSIPLNLTLLKSCQIVGVFWGAWSARHPDQFAQSLRELLALYAAGAIRPHVTGHYPLERGGDAIAALASRKATGKLVVTIG
jgi:NADPH2:quinone reductase